MMRILYAEDEMQLSVAVTEILKLENYEVTSVYNGREAWEELQKNRFDAVILDIMMPEMDGMEVLAEMRKHKMYTPVLLLTAKAETEDRIAGLSEGADDYLAKPFAMGELMARVNALIRRMADYRVVTLEHANISLNIETNELKSDKGSLRLSSRETELLQLFLEHADSTFTEAEILEQIWREEAESKAVELYISYLCNKLRQIHAQVTIAEEDATYGLCRIKE